MREAWGTPHRTLTVNLLLNSKKFKKFKLANTTIYYLTILLLFNIVIVKAERCQGDNKTTYLRTENVLSNEEPAKMLFDLTLHGCAKKCSEDSDNVNCHHFEYNAQRQTCALKAKSAQPVGHAVLMPASAGGQALFQQICIPSKNYSFHFDFFFFNFYFFFTIMTLLLQLL